VILTLAACSSGGPSSEKAARQESGAASASPSAVVESVDENAQATVRIHQLRLTAGAEKGGDRVRILVNNSTPDLRVTLSGAIDQEEHSVTVCSIIDRTGLAPSDRCVLPVADRAVDLPGAPGIKGIEISLAGRSTLVDLKEVALTYTAVDHHVTFLLPNIEPAPRDASCAPLGCPSFELNPARNGKLEATASWAESGSALLDIRTALAPPTNGTVATPPAYRVAASSSSASNAGPGSVTVGTTIRSGNSSVLALSNNGDGLLMTPVLEATWP
jgi:hypothetical protein